MSAAHVLRTPTPGPERISHIESPNGVSAGRGPESKLPSDRTPEEVASLLKRPFHPSVIKQRPVANGMVNYVAIDDVIERLNKSTLTWQWKVISIKMIDLPMSRKNERVEMPVIHVIGELEIPGLGMRQGIGTAPCEGTEDAAKIAESDAIKRAASMFGVPGGR